MRRGETISISSLSQEFQNDRDLISSITIKDQIVKKHVLSLLCEAIVELVKSQANADRSNCAYDRELSIG